MSYRFSCVIPCKDVEDPKLQDLIDSIRNQDFDQSRVEVLTITEGDSESAKAIGVKRASGDILLMLCVDNVLMDRATFRMADMYFENDKVVGLYSKHYAVVEDDNSLNRYFSLLGSNDPVVWWLGKYDRCPMYQKSPYREMTYMYFGEKTPSLGCNGTFINREIFLKADLDNYYPMDCCLDVIRKGYYRWLRVDIPYVWHRTTEGNLLEFLIRRYKYARDLYCDRRNRRWKAVGTKQDYWRVGGFVIASILVIPMLFTSIKGYIKVRDRSWFYHPVVCIGFTVMYGALTIRTLIKRCLKFL